MLMACANESEKRQWQIQIQRRATEHSIEEEHDTREEPWVNLSGTSAHRPQGFSNRQSTLIIAAYHVRNGTPSRVH